MKKIFAFIFASLAVIFMSVPFGGTAEAARVAVLPIQIDEAQVERASDFYSYYWDVMIEKFKYPDYELMLLVPMTMWRSSRRAAFIMTYFGPPSMTMR